MAIPTISVDDVVVGEADGVARFRVRLSAVSPDTVSVTYGTQNGSATGFGFDYENADGTLTFTTGQTVKFVQVPIVDDTNVETNESFFFNLSSPAKAVLGKDTGVATIIDNDADLSLPLGTPVMEISDPVVDEKAGEARFVITLDRPSTGTISANFTTTAGTAGATDFAAVGGGVSFAPGETAKEVVVSIVDDGAPEGNEKFNLVLSAVSGATLPDAVGTTTIWANDRANVVAPSISVDDLVVSEADGFAEFVVRLSAPSANTVSVSYATQGSSATGFGFDYENASGTLSFAPGETIQTVRVPLLNDNRVEGKEGFFFSLSSPGNALLGKADALATIIDNDTDPSRPLSTPVMAVSDPVVDEKAGEARFVITLDRPSTGTVSVHYTTQAGTAGAADFAATSGNLSFAPGETAKTVAVSIIDDGAPEGNEKFNLVLSAVSGATLPDAVGTATIWANDRANVVAPSISVDDLVVSEADGFAEFVVRLSAPSANTVSVSYATQGSSATGFGFDYENASGTLSFAPGETIQTVRVPLLNDNRVEGKEGFFFSLSSPGNALLGKADALATIIDNDTDPSRPLSTPVMAVSDPVVDEKAGEARFVITLDRPSTGTVSVHYTTQAGTAGAADFAATSGNLSFAPGETAKTVAVSIIDDGAPEGNEKFNLILSAVSGATLPDAVGTTTIWASDRANAVTPSISVDDLVVGETDGFAEFIVHLSAPSANTVSVSYATQGSSATGFGFDFQNANGTLAFAPGVTVQSVWVPIVNDTTVEPIESFFLDLSSPGNAVLDNTQAVATIIDDESHPAIFHYGLSNDTYVVSSSDTVILEVADGGTDTVRSSVNFVLPDNIENLILTGAGNISGTGNSLANRITGNSGNNVLSGGSGGDALIGGAGNDTYNISNPGETITELAGGGIDLVRCLIDFVLPGNVENLILIGAGNLNGTGNALANAIIGNPGNNVLSGGAGADTLNAGAGNDILSGGLGADALNGGAGFDYADYRNAAAGLIASLANPASNTGEAAGDAYASIEGLIGSNFNDALIGDGNGNRLRGGLGADALNGGAGFDYAEYNNAAAGLTASLANPASNTGEAAGDTYALVEGLIGSNFGDTLIGNINNNSLSGLLGNDVLDGGAGNDTLSGGAGGDRFVFAPGRDADTVTDFLPAAGDKIDLSGFATIHSVSQVRTRATQVGANTVLNFSNGDTLTLNNVNASGLTAADFVLAPGGSVAFAPPVLTLHGFGSAAAGGGWASEELYPRTLGDVNGDGRADIVGFGSAGAYTALGRANGTFSAPVLVLHGFGAGAAGGGWVSEDLYPRALGDVNGDGRADIVGFGTRGRLHRPRSSQRHLHGADSGAEQVRVRRGGRRLGEPGPVPARSWRRERRRPGRHRRLRQRGHLHGARPGQWYLRGANSGAEQVRVRRGGRRLGERGPVSACPRRRGR